MQANAETESEHPAKIGGSRCHICQFRHHWRMLLQLRRKDGTLPAAARARLEETESPAILIGGDYRIVAANRSYRALYGEGRVIGKTCYSVSHGYDSPCDENGEGCPLRAALDSGRVERVFHVHHGPAGPHHVDVEVEPIVAATGAYFLESLRDVHGASAGPEGEFIGRSPAFRAALGLLHRSAPSEIPVLLLGESGTGKEVAARAVHAASARREHAFVPVECSGIPEALFESELFGHEQGAFTGANRKQTGLVDVARGGTLFLDEIGDVPLPQQVKLLRLLESGTYRRVGGTEFLRADFRLVCATHRDLASMVGAGTFRQDLYHRLNAFPVRLPSLRERRADIPLLAAAFIAAQPARRRLHLTREALAILMKRAFPGNVRELRNTIERAVLLADGSELLAAHFVEDSPASPATGETTHDGAFVLRDVLALAELEKQYVAWAEARFGRDRGALASALGLTQRTLYRKLGALRRR